MSKTTVPTVNAQEKSLVERVSALVGSEEGSYEASGATVPTKAPEEHPALDGYRRLSPVQVIYRAEDYYRKLTKKCVGVSVVIAMVVTLILVILQR